MKKKALSLLLCGTLAASLLLAACGGGGGGGGTSGSGNSGGGGSQGGAPAKDSLVFSVPSEPTTMDPLNAAERITFLPVHAIHDTLLAEAEDGTIIGNIAESWDISEDGLVYTFKIREGVKFHQGQDMTIEDVIFSLETICKNKPSTSAS